MGRVLHAFGGHHCVLRKVVATLIHHDLCHGHLGVQRRSSSFRSFCGNLVAKSRFAARLTVSERAQVKVLRQSHPVASRHRTVAKRSTAYASLSLSFHEAADWLSWSFPITVTLRQYTLSLLSWILVAAVPPSLGAATIDVGSHDLLPNQSGQVVDLFVAGDEPVRGFNLRAQIGDGDGPLVEPIIESVSFSGGIWDAVSTAVGGGPIEAAPQFAQAFVVALEPPGQTVVANGLVAQMTISTVGIFTGSFNLLLSGTQIGEDSDLIATGGSSIAPEIANGTLHVVPEPTSATWVLMCLSFLALRVRKSPC